MDGLSYEPHLQSKLTPIWASTHTVKHSISGHQWLEKQLLQGATDLASHKQLLKMVELILKSTCTCYIVNELYTQHILRTAQLGIMLSNLSLVLCLRAKHCQLLPLHTFFTGCWRWRCNPVPASEICRLYSGPIVYYYFISGNNSCHT